MLSTNIGNSLKISNKKLEEYIRTVIPTGSTVHEKEFFDIKNSFPWKSVNELGRSFIMKYNNTFGTNYKLTEYSYDWLIKRAKELRLDMVRTAASIGTLGGGNHFIEIGKSINNDDYWITIHSGSRQFGKVICEYHQTIAEKILKVKRYGVLKTRIEEIKKTADRNQIQTLVDKAKKDLGLDFVINIAGLEYLEGQEAMDYFIDMIFAQKYAEVNRREMLKLILNSIPNVTSCDVVESVHNFIDFKDFIIRKGAIRSYIGERMIIPFNMRDGLLLCEGKSNEDWNCSAPHGAGRLMSRSKARKSVSIEEFTKSMEGIYTTSVCNNTLDESPMAYKDSIMIENAIADTATIIDRIKPVINIKDTNTDDYRNKD
jgi:tRNA-splicing ligase RtcB (3'-phosphate/5'-hydroxy nucleic acid ligase)